jgi:hypothetical protein
MAPPDPKIVARMRASAHSLHQNLSRELARIEAAGWTEDFQNIYGDVYLPRLTALALEAEHLIVFADWPLLAQPLDPDLAATQIRLVLELLRLLTAAL